MPPTLFRKSSGAKMKGIRGSLRHDQMKHKKNRACQEDGLQQFVAANPLEAASVLLHLPVSLLHD